MVSPHGRVVRQAWKDAKHRGFETCHLDKLRTYVNRGILYGSSPPELVGSFWIRTTRVTKKKKEIGEKVMENN